MFVDRRNRSPSGDVGALETMLSLASPSTRSAHSASFALAVTFGSWFRPAMVASADEGIVRRPEDEAMDRYADGDDSALARVYDALAPRLYGFLRRRLRDDALCEDLMQQTFLQMHRARGSFLRGAAVAPWALTIARRLLIDATRKAARARGVVASSSADSDAIDNAVDYTQNAETWVRAQELDTRLSAELAKLPPAQRQAFELIRIEGLSMQEAAELLDTSVSAVKLRAHRAYVALEAALGSEFAPEARASADGAAHAR
jgi:RNA polymerase sigma-70 factor, ECF subfamily